MKVSITDVKRVCDVEDNGTAYEILEYYHEIQNERLDDMLLDAQVRWMDEL